MDRLDQLLSAACGGWSDRIALVDRDEAMSYVRFDAVAADIALRLTTAGITIDEPVIVAVSNRAADLAGFLGVWRAGGVVVPIHRGAVEATASALLARTGARFVVNAAPGQRAPAALALADPVACLDRPRPPVRSMLEGAALIVFTSGSTGEPKGVVLSHRAFAAKLEMIDAELRMGPQEHTLLVLQLTFSFGQWVSLLTLLRGGTLRLVEKFEPEAVTQALIHDGITRVAMVPTMLRALLPAIEARGAPGFGGVIMAGGEPLPATLGSALRRAWPSAALWDIFGLTETNTCDFFVRPDEYGSAAGTIGRPGPGIACRIGAGGELQIKTPTIMRGYLDAPEATAAAFEDGWFKTGDLARRRADGRFELVGRAKDLINRGGNKVAPLEIERVFLEHPAVTAALAAGAPDPLRGEAIHLFVVARPGHELGAEQLLDWARQRLERYKLPDRIHFGASLPVGRTGKTDRSEFRRLIEAGG